MTAPLRFGRCYAEPGLWTNQLALADGRFFGTRVKLRGRRYRVAIGQEVKGCPLLDLRAGGWADSLDEAFQMAADLMDVLINEGVGA